MVHLDKDAIAARIAKTAAHIIDDMAGGDTFVLNLGVGIPTKISNYLTNLNVFIHAENGMLGVGPLASEAEAHPKLINASRQPVKETPGCCYIDSSLSFGMIRGGHVDATVLGAFEVDQQANVSNWIIPGGKQLGVGGAMDLASGANTLIVAMTHTGKNGPKLIKQCTLPITAYGTVRLVVTEYGVFRFHDGKVTLEMIAPDITLDELRQITELDFAPAAELGIMPV